MDQLTCAFSGHRPEKLPWGTDEGDPRCQALKIQMEKELRKLCREGVNRYICGMARGTDRYFQEILCRLREEYPIRIMAAVPCPSQARAWPEEERREYYAALRRCDEMRTLEERYSQGCMLRRNRFMVEQSRILMTVFDGSPGGTAATVAYARARGLRIVALWK